MALSFSCPRCGKEILVQYLQPGDEAICRSCGERAVVPESAAETDARPNYMREQEAPRIPGWTPEPPDAEEDLASRLSRLIAALVDGLVVLVFAIPLYLILFTRYPGSLLEASDAFRIVWIGIPSLLYFIGINSYFWATRGQSIGKMALGIKIVRIDGRSSTWGRIVGLRVLPIEFLGWIPIIGGGISLIDILFIFRSSKRCLHDEIARTKVVRCARPVHEPRAKQPEISELLTERRRQ
jgi:uncharacterized RDD family membrane protein YckC/DNA-directed RNA polymerase subunit RPC12/RpoP